MNDYGREAEMASRWKRLDKPRRREVMRAAKRGRPPVRPEDLPLVRWQISRQRRASWLGLATSLLLAFVFALPRDGDNETLRRLVVLMALFTTAMHAYAIHKFRAAERRL